MHISCAAHKAQLYINEISKTNEDIEAILKQKRSIRKTSIVVPKIFHQRKNTNHTFLQFLRFHLNGSFIMMSLKSSEHSHIKSKDSYACNKLFSLSKEIF